jgi:hypothetical protein
VQFTIGDPDARPAMWRISIHSKTDDRVVDFNETVGGLYEEVSARCWEQLFRASWRRDGNHQKVYVRLDRWSYKRKEWVKIGEHRGKLKSGAPVRELI